MLMLFRQEREQAELHTHIQQRDTAAHCSSVATHSVRTGSCWRCCSSQSRKIWNWVLGDYDEVYLQSVR